MHYQSGGNERIAHILSLEQKYPVDTWRVNNIHIWPIIRTYLYVEMWVEQNAAPASSNKNATLDRQHTQPMSISSRLVAMIHYAKFLLTPLKKSKGLFASSASYLDSFHGKKYHRLFDPLRIQNPNYTNSYIVFKGSKYIDGILRQISFGQFSYPQHLFARQYRKRGFIHSLEGYDDFYAEVCSITPRGKKLNRAFLEEAVTTIEKHAFIFSQLLKKTGAQEAISTCYYLDSKEFFGLNLAARRAGIHSIDIQHGGQGILHLAYAQFYKLPSNGYYELMPSHFWCWDEHSASEIQRWTSHSNAQHQAIVIGHPWLKFIQSQRTAIAHEKVIVLCSLQPFETLIQRNVLDCIHEAKDEFEWILRLHPSMAHRKKELEELIEKEGISSAIHPQTFAPLSLPETLAICDAHITRTSGTVIEAALMGVTTFITDEAGVQGFSDYVKSGEAVDAARFTGADLKRHLLAQNSRDKA